MSSATRIEARAAEWVAERDGDAWSHQRERDLDAWLAESATHRVAYLRLDAAWQRADRLRALRSAESSARSISVATSVRTAPRARRLQSLGFRAVAGIAILGFAILLNSDLSRLASAQVFTTPIGARESVSLQIRLLEHVKAVRFDTAVVGAVQQASDRLGLESRRMVSGAGHDAQLMSAVCPSAMIFGPSIDGVSHSPREHTPPEALEAGANVLLHAALDLAGRAF